jgi:hypothetical protein
MSRRLLVVAATVAALMPAALTAGTAVAAPTDPFILEGQLDQSTLTEKITSPAGVGVDQQTGNVIVFDAATSNLVQFDSGGHPVDFVGTESPEAFTNVFGGIFNPLQVVVDNSGTASQGNIYIAVTGIAVAGFGPDGKPLANFPIPTGEGTCGAAVGPTGNLWIVISHWWGEGAAFEYGPDGTPTGKSAPSVGQSAEPACPSAMDSLGDLYVLDTGGLIEKVDPVANTNLGVVGDGASALSMQVDPSTKNVYANRRTKIVGYQYTAGSVTEKQPFETLSEIGCAAYEAQPGCDSFGFAFDATGQYLYLVETTDSVGTVRWGYSTASRRCRRPSSGRPWSAECARTTPFSPRGSSRTGRT